MDTRKELPVARSPIVGLQYLAYPLSIILNYQECYPWFYSNYIQLQWNKQLVPHFTFFMDENTGVKPWIDQFMLRKSILQRNNVDIHSFIINSINDEYYFHSYFDEFYVSSRNAYQTRHFIHDVMITGYDLDSKEYTMLGFSNNRVFEQSKISFEQFREAYESTGDSNNYWEDQIKLMRKTDDLKYDFDLLNVYDMLQDYLLSRDSSEKFRMYMNPKTDNVYGMQIYSYLRKYFNLLIDKKINYDLRPVSILHEHKLCMVMRLKYMFEQGYIRELPDVLEAYESIERASSMLYKLQLKHQFSSDPKSLLGAIDKLNEIELKEKQTLDILLEEIQKVL